MSHMAGIAEGNFSELDEVIHKKRFNSCSIDYLQGYINSYEDNRGLVGKIIDLVIGEPTFIEAARKEYTTKMRGR